MASQRVCDTFAELIQNRFCIFDGLLIVVASVQLTLFSSFLTCIPFNGFSVWVSSRQSESVTDLLQIRFYFYPGRPLLSWPRLWNHPPYSPFDLLLPYSPPPLSLSLWPPRTPFSFMYFSFPLSCSWQVNPARKQLIDKTITQLPWLYYTSSFWRLERVDPKRTLKFISDKNLYVKLYKVCFSVQVYIGLS